MISPVVVCLKCVGWGLFNFRKYESVMEKGCRTAAEHAANTLRIRESNYVTIIPVYFELSLKLYYASFVSYQK